ncbi:Uncharacterised protein [Legionella quateirensis]|uniref:Uncharacterized protein n=1 Tax=Legionella quateirensis TaxID=45072 RepID=A0A378KV21_9GAMM|nr:Uncharacterised protein [Legionella quateirensis]
MRTIQAKAFEQQSFCIILNNFSPGQPLVMGLFWVPFIIGNSLKRSDITRALLLAIMCR